ncbi:MAG: hypothetical protein Q8Q59_02525 [Luteolibacter sp.]|nr:hypothetical protein [Luteolibacter sp.]
MINISSRKEAQAQVQDERFPLRQIIDHIPPHDLFHRLPHPHEKALAARRRSD